VSTFDDLLNGRPAHIQATFRAARAFIRSIGADISEQIVKDEAIYGRAQVFCTLAIERGGVQVRFPSDISLSDPHKLLHGAGTRSVRLRAPTDFSDAVRRLIRAAYQQS
jgi:uncharacterized protein DUF5655